ncbi:hypothetical protein [Pendulispora albinea]|uniref:Uncharacterized protein n=1 Tax=Pendulispora albinea TaxID=2741071 RepID=A0ABZ2M747_9BACT
MQDIVALIDGACWPNGCAPAGVTDRALHAALDALRDDAEKRGIAEEVHDLVQQAGGGKIQCKDPWVAASAHAILSLSIGAPRPDAMAKGVPWQARRAFAVEHRRLEAVVDSAVRALIAHLTRAGATS